MPLDRQHVTRASRIMLPVYVALAVWFGLVYLIDPQGRAERAPALTLARLLLPMWAWGLMFLALAALMVAAMLTGRRSLMVYVLMIDAATNLAWAFIYGGAVLLSNAVSYAAPAPSLALAAACTASAVSLITREV